ncbi:MAG: LptA/OstA family protein [Puniceicoccales bacterium]|nr:LptA/OstA family protein [Puniceicoccales bacterium]
MSFASFAFLSMVLSADNLMAGDVFSEISSDRLEISPKGNHMEFKFSGNVKIKNTEFQASADRVIVIAKPPKDQKSLESSPSFDAIKTIVAEGNATIQQGERRGVADRIEVDTDTCVIFLTGNAKVSDKVGVVCGDMNINYREKSVDIIGTEPRQVLVQINNNGPGDSEVAPKSDAKQNVTDGIDS